MVKKIFLASFFLLIYNLGYSQTKVAPCSNFTQNINRDSINKVKTTFQVANFYFLRSSCTDSAYVNSPLYNQTTFNSTEIIADDSRKRKNFFKN